METYVAVSELDRRGVVNGVLSLATLLNSSSSLVRDASVVAVIRAESDDHLEELLGDRMLDWGYDYVESRVWAPIDVMQRVSVSIDVSGLLEEHVLRLVELHQPPF